MEAGPNDGSDEEKELQCDVNGANPGGPVDDQRAVVTTTEADAIVTIEHLNLRLSSISPDAE